ncbi:MAG: Pterin-4-alpha-carbinolamine dehydratase, partial [uncultured Acidimicrobiales bacterium]
GDPLRRRDPHRARRPARLGAGRRRHHQGVPPRGVPGGRRVRRPPVLRRRGRRPPSRPRHPLRQGPGHPEHPQRGRRDQQGRRPGQGDRGPRPL